MPLAYNFSECLDDPCKAQKDTPTRESVTFAIMHAAQAGILPSARIENREQAIAFSKWTMLEFLKNQSEIHLWSDDDKNSNRRHYGYLSIIHAIGLIGVEVWWS